MGQRFAVWAPDASDVAVVIDGERSALAVEPSPNPGGGWWSAELAHAGPGTDYGFSLDRGPVRPDPRSAWQPHGVHGPSRVYDQGAFRWGAAEAAWRGVHLPSAVLYEVHVGTFSPEGTFDGVAGRLDHLVELGVDAIELLPVVEFAGSRGWGYDGVDLYAPHHCYGGPDGLKRLVEACHARNLGVVMDVVYNHLGPAGNYLGEFGPYFTDAYRTGWGSAVNFDGPGSDEVRRFVIDNAALWLADYHCDGLRLDAVHAIKDESATHILEELALSVEALATHVRRPLFVIAESDRNDPRLVRSRDGGGYGLDGVWADDLHHALHATLTGERAGYYADFGPLALVAAALGKGFAYSGQWSAFRRRHHGAPPTGVDGSHFVVALQNHDQVGNRAAGERMAHLVTPARARVGAALVLLSPFVPLLFQGEEWAASSPFQYFTDHEAELGRAVSEGRRREFSAFGWAPEDVPDPQDPATFVRSRLDWDEVATGQHGSMLGWYRTLVGLRRRFSQLSDGRRDAAVIAFDEDAGWLVLVRGSIRVAVNLGPSPAVLQVEGDSPALLAQSEPGVRLSGTTVELPPDSVAVLTTSPPDATS